MAQATINITDRSLTSTYQAGVNSSGNLYKTTPTTASSTTTISVPANSQINWVRIYCDSISSYHATSIRQVQVGTGYVAAHSGYFVDGTLLNKTLFEAGNLTIRFVFKSGTANTNYPTYSGSPVSLTNTSTIALANMSIVIDYDDPDGGGDAVNPGVSGLSLNKSICKCGDLLRFNILNQSPGVYHKARVGISGITLIDEIVPQGDTYHDYSVPIGWQQYIPTNGTTLVAYARLFTYSNSARTTQIGYSDKPITLTLSDDNYPTIINFESTRIPGFDDEDITGYVQNYSSANVMATAEALYGATIAEYKVIVGTWSGVADFVEGEPQPIITPTIGTSGAVTIRLEVKDSRGRKTIQDQNIEVDEYSSPALHSPTAFRSTDAGVAARNGTWATLQSGFDISSLQTVNVATLWGRVYQVGTTPLPDYTAMEADTALPFSGLSVTYSYIVDIKVVDKLSEGLFTTTIPSGKTLIHWLKPLLGAAIGRYAERENALTSEWPIWVNNNPVCDYDVGDLYLTISTVHPETRWPGTHWASFGVGRTLVGIDASDTAFDTVSETGGAKSNEVSGIAKIGVFGTSSWIKSASKAWTAGHKWTINSTATNTDNLSSGAEIDATVSTLPPYIVVYMWVRIAD